ncbi:putative methyltransferase-domain-containing protein [Polychytrium aggregatum]|uniref:putative methyltransferase-domain-containing protein n=1 Tax=Polychytrium aggregatum TaxID=110093 RepID=UPI0022FDB894|nr:putative methyltransferase-domain-containing protein [Polychytrium aggregatum]KAI9204012.1 putative methyltransferase-domain-containing protein [Polychytrium aggregatum]
MVAVTDPDEEIFCLYTHMNSWSHNAHVDQRSSVFDLGSISVRQDLSLLSTKGVTGSVVWDASVVLVELLQSKQVPAISLSGARILELGSGAGLLGSFLLHQPIGHLTLTDQSHLLRLLQKNVAMNHPSIVSAESSRLEIVEWAWGEPDGFRSISALNPPRHTESESIFGLDYIIATDCVYNEFVVPKLVFTLHQACMLSDRIRDTLGRRSPDSKANLNPASTSAPAPDSSFPPTDRSRTIAIVAQELRSDLVHQLFVKSILEIGFRMVRLVHPLLVHDFIDNDDDDDGADPGEIASNRNQAGGASSSPGPPDHPASLTSAICMYLLWLP